MLKDDPRFEHECLGEAGSMAGDLRALWRARWSADLLILNIDHRRLLLACILFGITSPRPLRRCRIVSVDILLRPPKTLRARILNAFKSLLYKQVDLFILYFKNIDGYARHFGIPRERTAYVPFKVNSWEKLKARRNEIGEGDYVLLSGATLRDHATFVRAAAKSGVPAVLLIPGEARPAIERTSWFRSGMPPNLRVDFHTDGKEDTFLRYIENARIVCFPRFAWDIASSGISGYLCGMALGKFVAISRGPGADDVLADSESAAFFEPGDSDELARLIKDAWDRPEYRRRIAANGTAYADSLEGEERLLRDILNTSVERAGIGTTLPKRMRNE
jgi:glycosyltransferase involved in cell wall biosynthesis